MTDGRRVPVRRVKKQSRTFYDSRMPASAAAAHAHAMPACARDPCARLSASERTRREGRVARQCTRASRRRYGAASSAIGTGVGGHAQTNIFSTHAVRMAGPCGRIHGGIADFVCGTIDASRATGANKAHRARHGSKGAPIWTHLARLTVSCVYTGLRARRIAMRSLQDSRVSATIATFAARDAWGACFPSPRSRSTHLFAARTPHSNDSATHA
ncbi:MAG: hypothetical protein QOI13_2400 [Paraburkholderia sp.]|nr:hypothetical protein [Paraburkholderia sp.]